MPTSFHSSEPDDRKDVDLLAKACAIFEGLSRGDDRPDVADFLERTLPQDRSTLLSRVAGIDIRERIGRGELPDADDDTTRFPLDRATILGIDWTARPRGTAAAAPAGSATAEMPDKRSQIGRFELIERLGVGGFGEVWRAFDPQLQRDVAIKIGHFGVEDTEQVGLLLHEARSAGRLRHRGIVSVHEVAVEDRIAYIVSDYIPGMTLAERIKGGRLGIREAVEIAGKLAEAIAHAHQCGVIHRDVKPANVLLDQSGDPHLIDFGVARRKDGDVTISREGEALGTPAYMAPEQARGELAAADHRADIYAVGIVLFEMLAGRRAYPGDAREALQRVLIGPPQRLRLFRHDLPRDLETIIEIAMSREPECRYSTAVALAEDLGRFLRGEPIVARRNGRWRGCWRWLRQRTVPITVAAHALLLALWPWAVRRSAGLDALPGEFDGNSIPAAPLEDPPTLRDVAADTQLLDGTSAAELRLPTHLRENRRSTTSDPEPRSRLR